MPPENMPPDQFRSSGNRLLADEEHPAGRCGGREATAKGACSCSTI